jgi:hypothetical protein
MVGGELMILSARDSKLFSLNETATLIWEGADGATPLSEIVDQRICGEFGGRIGAAWHPEGFEPAD